MQNSDQAAKGRRDNSKGRTMRENVRISCQPLDDSAIWVEIYLISIFRDLGCNRSCDSLIS